MCYARLPVLIASHNPLPTSMVVSCNWPIVCVSLDGTRDVCKRLHSVFCHKLTVTMTAVCHKDQGGR